MLGVNRDASPDEIKKAYRKKALQYHPDRNQGSKEAEEHMKEINEAYAMLTDPNYKPNNSAHQGGYGASGYGPGYGSGFGGSAGYGWYNPFSGWSGGYGGAETRGSSQNDDPELRAARNYVMNGYYQQALTALADVSHRTDECYYLSALANTGMGNRVIAREHAQTACQMDPTNGEYQMLLQQIEMGGAAYHQRGDMYGSAGDFCRNPFMRCIAVNILLNCLCGRFFCC